MSFRPKKHAPYILYVTCWFFVNLLTLTSYPAMHSDEAWLAGLSRTMMEKGTVLTTEPFFDAAPRAPHTLKVLYHLLQMPLISTFGYELFSVRLLSLIFGTVSLILLILLFEGHNYSLYQTLAALILITTSSQYVYATHFGRQEMILVAVLSGCLCLYSRFSDQPVLKALTIGTLIGLSIMIHPNAFFMAVMIGLIYVFDWLAGQVRLREMILFVMPMALLALINIAVTLFSSPDFLTNYWAYASELQVGAAPAARTGNFVAFYIKLYQQISGTYFLTDLRWVFWIGGLSVIALLAALLLGFRQNEIKESTLIRYCIAMVLGFNIALFIIGRYNQTSIIFMVLPLLILITETVRLLTPSNYTPYLLAGIILFSLNMTYEDYNSARYHDYTDYTAFLSENIHETNTVLANLTGGFTMAPNQFYDIRNLAYMDTDIETYLINNGIDTIVWYEEYDYIHRNSQWQILYGDDSHYYDDIKKILEDYGTLRAETTSTFYGNRIIRYQDGYEWGIWVYELELK